MDSVTPTLAPIGFPIEAIVIFVGVVSVSVWLDLFAHRKSEEISIKNAAAWSAGWIGISLCWYAYLRFRYGGEYADLFLAGYALEKSLSVDNLMVFVAIFSSFAIHGAKQHRVLYYGIMGAIVFRFVFIGLGTSLLLVGPYILFIFSAFVLWSAYKMWSELGGGDDEEIEDYSEHFSVKWTQKFFPVIPMLVGDRFFVSAETANQIKQENPELHIEPNKRWYATPMLLCLAVIEASDIMFSFDSVPAVIAVTQQPLLVYSSIIFAILGLRSLYFVLAALQKYLCHLDKAVIVLLVYIGLKLGAEALYKVVGWPDIHVTPLQNVVFVLGTLLLGVLASFVFPDKEKEKAAE